jgi:hypothetical protein
LPGQFQVGDVLRSDLLERREPRARQIAVVHRPVRLQWSVAPAARLSFEDVRMKTAMLPLRAGEFVGMCAKASWSHLRLTWLYTLAGDHPPDTFGEDSLFTREREFENGRSDNSKPKLQDLRLDSANHDDCPPRGAKSRKIAHTEGVAASGKTNQRLRSFPSGVLISASNLRSCNFGFELPDRPFSRFFLRVVR